MGKATITSVDGIPALARRAAEEWISDIRERVKSGSTTYSVAICGGRVAADVFRNAVDALKSESALTKCLHFFWADERSVPPEDAESNFGAAHRLLLEPLQIPRGQIHRIRGELDSETAATSAGIELQQTLGVATGTTPVFDFVLLSMGEDGHVASLFPGAEEPIVSPPPLYRAVIGSKPPPKRITLSYAVIAAARRTLVLVSEPQKATALHNSLSSNGNTPLAEVIRRRTETEILTSFPV